MFDALKDRTISKITDTDIQNALLVLSRAAQRLTSPISKTQDTTERAYGKTAAVSQKYFNRYVFGTFRNNIGANMFALFTPTRATYVTMVVPFIIGGNTFTLGILPNGSTTFTGAIIPKLIETAPLLGSVIESDKILVWNTNVTSASLQKVYEKTADNPGKLINVGETLYMQNTSGSIINFVCMFEFCEA
jgi:hypothetical protein